MSRKFKLALDVDLTTVDTLTPWLLWAGAKESEVQGILDEIAEDTRSKKSQYMYFYRDCDYITKINPELEDPLEYWRTLDYETLTPYAEFQPAMAKIPQHFENKGVELQVIVVSSCFPEHLESKKRAIEKWLDGFNPKFIATNDKEFVDFDLLIDDNALIYSKCFQAGKNCLLFPSELSIVRKVEGTVTSKESTKNGIWKMLGDHFETCFDAVRRN